MTPKVAVRLAAEPGLRIRSWDDGLAVVYAPSTATTHLVSAAAAQLLARLGERDAEPDVGDTELAHALLHAGLLRPAA